jgi:hypothetical protein
VVEGFRKNTSLDKLKAYMEFFNKTYEMMNVEVWRRRKSNEIGVWRGVGMFGRIWGRIWTGF